MEMLQGVWKQHLRPRAVVGYFSSQSSKLRHQITWNMLIAERCDLSNNRALISKKTGSKQTGSRRNVHRHVQHLHSTFGADKFESASRRKKVNSLNLKKILSTLYFAFRDDFDSCHWLSSKF